VSIGAPGRTVRRGDAETPTFLTRRRGDAEIFGEKKQKSFF